MKETKIQKKTKVVKQDKREEKPKGATEVKREKKPRGAKQEKRVEAPRGAKEEKRAEVSRGAEGRREEMPRGQEAEASARVKMRGGALLAPLPPALVVTRDGDKINVMTAAWTGILCTDPAKTYISIRPSRYTYGILQKTREYVLCLPTAKMARAVDFCGIYTGAKADKFARCGFTPVPSEEVAPPTIAECPVALECTVTDIVPLGTHDMFLADIRAVTADAALFDAAGKLHIERAGLLAYAHGEYYALGERVGKFGFSATKRKTPRGGRGK